MQSFGISPSFHCATGELVDDDNFVVLHHVIHVSLEHLVGAESLVDVVHHRDIFHVVKVVALQQISLAQQNLDGFRPLFREVHRAGLFVLFVVGFREFWHQEVDFPVQL